MRVSIIGTAVLCAASFSFGTAFGLILGVPAYKELHRNDPRLIVVNADPVIKGRVLAPAVLDRLNARLDQCESSLWHKIDKQVTPVTKVPPFKTTLKHN